MRTQSERRAFVVVIAAAAAFCSDARAQIAYTTIAVTSDEAPGVPGSRLGAFATPIINAAGDVAFEGAMQVGPGGVTGANNNAIWSWQGGVGSLVVREGQPAPGTADAVFGGFRDLRIAASMDAAFIADLKLGVGDTDASNDDGVWVVKGGAPTLVARKGSVAPGGETFLAFSALRMNASSDAAFYGAGVTATAAGALATIAQPNQEAPGTGGAVFASFAPDGPHLNGAGDIAFVGSLVLGQNGVDTTNNTGLWAFEGGALGMVARRGDAAPGTGGAVFDDIAEPDINDNADIAVYAMLRLGVGGVSDTNNAGIWLRDAGSLDLVVQAGDEAPGTGGAHFDDFGMPIINNAGVLAFEAFLPVGLDGVNVNDERGIWSGARNNLALIARAGSPAPGANGAKFADFDSPTINTAGDIAFTATLQTGGAVNPTNNEGLWIRRADTGELVLVARKGNQLDVDDAPGTQDPRTITFIGFRGASGLHDGRECGLSETGQLAVAIGFADGTSGIFVAVPAKGPCSPADLAEPFAVFDFSDIFAFLVAFGAMDPIADFAAPFGVFDFSDVLAYVAAFGAGCP